MLWYGYALPLHQKNTENIVNNKGQLLQDPFLNLLRKEHVPVSIYLVNGIKLQGQIESFDQYVVLLRNTVTQMVYKHAISTIVPGRAVNFSIAGHVVVSLHIITSSAQHGEYREQQRSTPSRSFFKFAEKRACAGVNLLGQRYQTSRSN